MELALYDTSQVISLRSVHRPDGQLFMPEFVQEIASRYSFMKIPTLEELIKRELKFSMGRFENSQIQDFTVYADGFIVSSASDTDILIGFISDLTSWAQSAFGIVPTLLDKPETYFESTMVVKSVVDLVQAASPRAEIAATLKRAFTHASLIDAEFIPSGFILDVDVHDFKGRRKPIQFMVERRLGLQFGDNAFFSRAPLPTKAHLALLGAVEDLVRRGR